MSNPAITAAIIAASQQEEILSRLRKEGATSAPRAIDLPAGTDSERKRIDDAVKAGIVTRTAHGLYYLNERALLDRNESQGHLALVVLLVVGSLLASGIALVAFVR